MIAQVSTTAAAPAASARRVPSPLASTRLVLRAQPQPQPAQQQQRQACGRRRVAPIHAAAASEPSSAPGALLTPPNPLLVSIVEALFGFPPLFEAATKKARATIIARSEAIGLDWSSSLAQLQAQPWDELIEQARDPAIQAYPAYYTQPFHAYKQGNLCWEAALEFNLSSASVHAPVMDPANKAMDPRGDEKLRSSYGACVLQLLAELPGAPQRGDARAVLDLGCATGLSSLALLRDVYPSAHVTGVDLSPHMVAVGRFLQQQRQAASGQAEPLTLLHRAAEDTRLPAGSFDAVSMCLVAHELPQAATRDILREAYRLLRPGGVMSIMEMNPRSPAFQRIFSNPFAYTAFKSTEPHLVEYVTLDLHGAMRAAGFDHVAELENSPRHRTVLAQKPA